MQIWLTLLMLCKAILSLNSHATNRVNFSLFIRNIKYIVWECIFHADLHFPTFEPPHDKTNKLSVRLAKTQISLGIRPVWSESSLCAQWIAKDPSFLHADSEDSDQTGRIPRLIWVFAGRTATLLVLSRRGSFQSFLPLTSDVLLTLMFRDRL